MHYRAQSHLAGCLEATSQTMVKVHEAREYQKGEIIFVAKTKTKSDVELRSKIYDPELFQMFLPICAF